MQTTVPAGFEDTVASMAASHAAILTALRDSGIALEPPPRLGPGRARGAAAARAHPMQGVLKYHGMSDWRWRIAFLPSISVTSDAGYTTTYVEFDPTLSRDSLMIGGREASGRELDRAVQSLDVVRQLAGVSSRARVVSRNIVRASRPGKGLGTSASASAALATAAIAALWGAEAVTQRRFVSTIARLLAGSGCRSAAGGLALWLSYPGIPQEESFAVRLDTRGQLDGLRLITVPIDSRIGLKTEQAHADAPHSSFFRSWMLSRGAEVLECIAAAHAGDWRAVGAWAELDSIRLHGVTMSGSRENKLIGWEPENITLFRLCNDLRATGVPVYCSTDTGPTAVFLTHRDHEEAVVAGIEALGLGLEIVRGRVAGGSELVDLDTAWAELSQDER